jgi:hypothetical protein
MLMNVVACHNGRPPLSYIECYQTQDLVKRCWAPEPADRPTFVEIEDELRAILVVKPDHGGYDGDYDFQPGLNKFFSLPNFGMETIRRNEDG